MLRLSSKRHVLGHGRTVVGLVACGLLALGLGLIGLGLAVDSPAGAAVEPPLSVHVHVSAPRPGLEATARQAAEHQPHSSGRATISLYEHTIRRAALRAQGCSASRRGVGGIVILDFGQPAYNGHSYGANLFSGRFADDRTITRALLAYAVGYEHCLPSGSTLHITLARGTSNYRPQVPSAYKAGRKWARETMALQHLLRQRGLDDHVTAAAADDVEPAWDPTFHRTRDFYLGFRDARTGHLLYNFGSLDGGVGAIWTARQVFFVTSGMRYARALPEIYNHLMACQWAELAHIARNRYHRPVKFAGVMTMRTSGNGAMKPRDAHEVLVRALASRIGPAAAQAVPPSLTNIVAAE